MSFGPWALACTPHHRGPPSALLPTAPPLPQVATLVQADWLFLLTDVPNLFTANPNVDPNAQPIYEVADLSKLHVSACKLGWSWLGCRLAHVRRGSRPASAAPLVIGLDAVWEGG